MLTLRWGRLLRNGVITLVLLALSVGERGPSLRTRWMSRIARTRLLPGCNCCAFQARQRCISRRLLGPTPGSPASRLEHPTPKLLRVGYMPTICRLPISTARATSSGSTSRWHIAGAGSRCELAFVPGERDRMTEQVNEGYCDIVMSGTVITPERAQVAFSVPYTDVTLAFVVKDHRLEESSVAEKRSAASKRPALASSMCRTMSTECSGLCRRQRSCSSIPSPSFSRARVKNSMPFCTRLRPGLPGVCSTRPIRSLSPSQGC